MIKIRDNLTLKSCRIIAGIKAEELAEKVFVSYQAVSQWENGTTNPDINTIIENCKKAK